MWRWDQAEPFGNNPANEDPDANSVAFDLPLRLPGQRYDKETGLHYNYFRDYDPSLGRYGESDPIGLDGGINTYAYGAGRPLQLVDPDGLAVKWSGSLAGGGVVAGGGGAIYYYEFTSECKCNRIVTVRGIASFLALGIGLRGPRGIPEGASGSGGGMEMVAMWSDCPMDSDFNGPAQSSGINVITGGGRSYLSSWVLGRVRQVSYAGGVQYGWDLSLSYGVGWSGVASSSSKCC